MLVNGAIKGGVLIDMFDTRWSCSLGLSWMVLLLP